MDPERGREVDLVGRLVRGWGCEIAEENAFGGGDEVEASDGGRAGDDCWGARGTL